MYLDFLQNKYRILFNSCSYDKPTKISAMPEMGKTVAALNYCAVKQNCLYLPFANMEAAFALKTFCNNNPETFGNSTDWKAFFDKLEILAKEKRLTVFFDNASVRNDKSEFYEELNLFLKKNTHTAIIFLCRPWEKIDVECDEIEIDNISLKAIADFFKINDKEAANIFLLTSGITSIFAEYDIDLSFEDNIRNMLCTKSAFYNYPIKLTKDCFRSPETYNTLLYAIANGYNRISEISAFSGQPKNKCDKYLKSLIDYNLVSKECTKKGYANYYPANSYFSLWYKFLFTAVPNSDGSFDEGIYKKLTEYFYDFIVPEFYKNLCYNWIKINFNFWLSIKTDEEIEKLKNIAIDDITFDFVYNENGKPHYFYFDTDFNGGINKTLVHRIDKITTKITPFYENEYFYLSINRIPDSMAKLSQKYDNIHFVRLSVLFTAYKTGKKRKHFK